MKPLLITRNLHDAHFRVLNTAPNPRQQVFNAVFDREIAPPITGLHPLRRERLARELLEVVDA